MVDLQMRFQKMENSVWIDFPKNDPSVTDTVYVPITGGKKNGVHERIHEYRIQRGILSEVNTTFAYN